MLGLLIIYISNIIATVNSESNDNNNFKNNFIYLRFEQSSIIQNMTNQNTTIVPFTYGVCEVYKCGDVHCAAGPQSSCVSQYQQSNNQSTLSCQCNPGYITYEDQCPFKCCYKQKSATTAFLLEFFIGFGAGHFYVGNLFLGYIKAFVYSLFSCLGIFMLVRKIIRAEIKPFIYKVIRTIGLLLCSCIFIGWQSVDAILFAIEGYSDGNSAPLYFY